MKQRVTQFIVLLLILFCVGIGIAAGAGPVHPPVSMYAQDSITLYCYGDEFIVESLGTKGGAVVLRVICRQWVQPDDLSGNPSIP